MIEGQIEAIHLKKKILALILRLKSREGYITQQPRSQGLSSSRSLEKKRDSGNEVV